MSRRLRVAWLGQRAAGKGDGLTVYSREVTRGLRARDVEVVFVHHDADSGGAGSVGLPALSVAGTWRIAAPGARRRLREALRRRSVDLVHVSLSFSSLDFGLPELCRELGVPLVATLHAPFDLRMTRWGWLSQMLYRIYAHPLSNFDRVVVFGPEQLRLLTGMGVPDGLVRVIPNGVDVERFSIGPSEVGSQFEGERLFVYLGRLAPEKNVDLLLDAFCDAAPPSGVRLAVAGSGSLRGRLERRYRDPRVTFLGLVADEAERIGLLRSAEAFFLPSAIEGLSLALLEAMACGCCPVATDVGCDRDAVSGVGISLDPQNLSADLRFALRLLSDTPSLSRELGAQARERAVTRYSLTANLDALLGMYRELLGAGALNGAAS
ncbi:MAG: glycosyltransferase family 4 protein [bacterium]|jgi:glycosyltransferase involved in cell wall biosynthesis|nr:glycosyltransferase family 4 protein [bacterium]